ncbi:hypothetical protein GCM10011379_50730 [Filimonas zeae]|uniref:Uncharacterized protein n=2 Tax=Filimonas zeae TaxID=1737353 RepID=A0A917J4V0_9BACT|nr:hypothetical protein GCM10011379_50730 [Filimonas zeae]
MYVYGAEFYKQRFEGRGKVLNVLSFVKPFNVMLAIMNSRAIELFEINQKETFQMISGCNVLVYISTWPFDISELSALNTEAYDYCIVKLHPHIQQFKEDKGDNGRFIFVGTTILAEVLISVLLENNNQLYIYHHNSTSTIYLSEKQHNIKSIRNIALHQDEYNIIYKGLKPAS